MSLLNSATTNPSFIGVVSHIRIISLIGPDKVVLSTGSTLTACGACIGKSLALAGPGFFFELFWVQDQFYCIDCMFACTLFSKPRKLVSVFCFIFMHKYFNDMGVGHELAEDKPLRGFMG